MIQSKIAYAAGGIDIPSLPEEIQVALNQVMAGEIELTDFISQMNQFQFSGVYTKYAPEDVVPEHREKVSKPLWSRNVGTLDGNDTLYKGFFTSSIQSASTAAYYLDVYNASPNLVDQYGPLVQNYPYMEVDRDNWVDADTQFAVAFGQYLGHGSKSTEATDNSATKAIYSQYRNILLDPGDEKFTFDPTKVGGGDSDNICIINVNRARYKEKLDPGNWELKLAKPRIRVLDGGNKGGHWVVESNRPDGTLGDHPHDLLFRTSSDAYGITSNWTNDEGTLVPVASNSSDWFGNQEQWKNIADDDSSAQWLSNDYTGSFTFVSASGEEYPFTMWVNPDEDAAQSTHTSGSWSKIQEGQASFSGSTWVGTLPGWAKDRDIPAGSVGKIFRNFGLEGAYIELTDNSKAQISHKIKAGQRVFNVISGSIESEADLGAADFISEANSKNAYGLFYPDIGVFCLNANAFTSSFASGGLATTWNVGSDYYDTDGGNDVTFWKMIRDGYKFQARSEETVTSTHFFCRIKNKQYNFSNNPTFFTASDGSFTNDDFYKNPRTYITTVGLYNDANELLAVAKLSRPLLKSFDREAVIKVKLDF